MDRKYSMFYWRTCYIKNVSDKKGNKRRIRIITNKLLNTMKQTCISISIIHNLHIKVNNFISENA